MRINENEIIGELVTKNYRTASVFKKYDIDFCCQGNRTIREACRKKSVDTDVVLNELNSIWQEDKEKTTDYNSWPLDLLADYIEKKHHRYVEKKVQEIKSYLDKIVKVHREQHPELLDIQNHFNQAAGKLAQHMKREELVLFPFIRKMEKAKQNNFKIQKPHFGTIQNPIQMMMQEHDTEGGRFREIAKLSNSYTVPKDACKTYLITFALLKEFEEDLHLHIHLENNILFPKAVILENQLS